MPTVNPLTNPTRPWQVILLKLGSSLRSYSSLEPQKPETSDTPRRNCEAFDIRRTCKGSRSLKPLLRLWTCILFGFNGFVGYSNQTSVTKCVGLNGLLNPVLCRPRARNPGSIPLGAFLRECPQLQPFWHL